MSEDTLLDGDESEAEILARQERMEREIEMEAERLCGPKAERRARNQKYVGDLVSRHTEPVIRGLLKALSRLERPLCARVLSECDIATCDLADIIQPYEILGKRFNVIAAKGSEFTVEIRCGWRTSGDGGEFVIARRGDDFRVVKELGWWIS